MKSRIIAGIIIILFAGIAWFAITLTQEEPQQVESRTEWQSDRNYAREPFDSKKATKGAQEQWCSKNPGKCKGYDK